MANDGKIYITISDKRPDDSLPSGNSITNITNNISNITTENGNRNGFVSYLANQKMASTIKNLMSQGAIYAMNNIGNFTGRYDVQTDVNNARSAVSAVSSIAWGFMLGGPAVGIGAIINEASKDYFEILSNVVQNNKVNYEISQLRERAGLNALKDGSRGTEN